MAHSLLLKPRVFMWFVLCLNSCWLAGLCRSLSSLERRVYISASLLCTCVCSWEESRQTWGIKIAFFPPICFGLYEVNIPSRQDITMTVGLSENLRVPRFYCHLGHLGYSPSLSQAFSPPVHMPPLLVKSSSTQLFVISLITALARSPVVCRIQPKRLSLAYKVPHHLGPASSPASEVPPLSSQLWPHRPLVPAIPFYRLSPLHKILPHSNSSSPSDSIRRDPV